MPTMSSRTCSRRGPVPPAIVIAPAIPAPSPPTTANPLFTSIVFCAASFAHNLLNNQHHEPQHIFQIQLPELKMPKVSLPKLPGIRLPEVSLPEVDLPVIGKIGGKKKQPTKPAVSTEPRGTGSVVPTLPSGANVRVRVGASTGTVAVGKEAPTYAELQKARGDSVESGATIGSVGKGKGWKQFPLRRMPGASMEQWRGLVKDMKKD